MNPEDGGEYRVVAKNSLGESTANIIINFNQLMPGFGLFCSVFISHYDTRMSSSRVLYSYSVLH